MATFGRNSTIRIFIADDDATTRTVLRLLLQEQSCIVVGEASDGERAFELCSTLKPQIAFLDIDMPKLNGNQVAQKLRTHYPDIGIVIVSALSTVDNVEEAKLSGASAFIVKPFTAAKLIQAMEACLKKTRHRAGMPG
ncbi:two-component system chemotaxis response regulator CheY [Paucimonas lemoignei]|uniref:Two-component system chemotaxis response regulator CheY n=1 Tax=Paucimonas lemoignei TaxID=29443 RepID=A0A4R3HZ62_PAULE|nr:response regulator [Paucimonas lemoignei]TCS38687.1 two-component system chemotaxis response regulator CheY [Paucimonas lemoignei]